LQDKRARWLKFYHVLLPVVVLAISGWVHGLADLTFPVPWDDEAIFIYPAASISTSGHLQTDSLNPERPVFYHPPAYPIALGLFFKIVPPGLRSARLFSWLLLAVTYVFCLRMVREFASRTQAELILSLFFLGGHTTIAGNIARPESLVLAFCLGGYLLLLKGRPWPAASVLVLGCLVHPAAWFLALAAGGAYLIDTRGTWPVLAKRDIPWVVLATACLTAMAAYLGSRWEWVWNDLQVSIQFLSKTWGQRLAVLASPWNGIPALLAISLPVVTLRMRRPLFALSLLVLTLWFLPIYRPEMWYSVYTAFAYALGACLLVELAACCLPAAQRRFGTALIMVALLVGGLVLGHVPDPRHYPDYFWWRHMRIRAQPDYIHPTDYPAISAALQAEPVLTQPRRVAFYPNGDGTLFIGRLPNPWIPFYPAFTDDQPDAIIFHQSRLAYPGHSPILRELMQTHGVNPSQPTHMRDETEKWFVHFLPSPAAPSPESPPLPHP
jgi:hypothetical protein